MQLNLEQAAAAYSASEGIALVEAGAGSGKTATLRKRVRFLIDEDKRVGLVGSKLLVIAFNKKVQAELEKKLQLDLGPDFQYVTVKTFHALAMSMVYRGRVHLPIKAGANIEPVTQTWKLDKYAREWLSKHDYKNKPDEKQMNILFGIEGLRIRLGLSLDDAIQKAKEESLNLEKDLGLKDWEIKNWVQTLRDFRYETGYLTMDDFLELAANLPSSAYRACNFAHVLADELQDLNFCQRAMIKGFMPHARSFFGVGDPSQSIYSFTGADATIFEKMRKDFPEARLYRLTTNYRSTPQILSYANEILQYEVKTTMRLQARPDAPDGTVPLMYTGIGGLLDWINTLRASGYAWKEIMILYRVRSHTPELETGLAEAGIPYHVADGSYFEQPVIQDLLCYLYLLYSKKAEKAHWMRTFSHVKFLGEATAGEMWDKTDGDPLAWPRDMYPKCARGSMKALIDGYWRFYDRIDDQKSDVGQVVDTLFHSLQEYWLRKFGDDVEILEERLATAESFCEWIKESGKTGREIVDHVDLIARGKVEDADADVIEVLSIHKSKGLECRGVALWAIADGNLPFYRGDPAEERRLGYVGSTRAMEDLALITVKDKDRHGTFGRYVPNAEHLVATIFDSPELADFLN